MTGPRSIEPPFRFDGALETNLTVDHPFSATKDDHPVVFGPHSRVYSSQFSAEPGYIIEECNWKAMSATRDNNIRCEIQDGRMNAAFSVQLTSGPAVDRWRGWWTGTVSLRQRTDK